MTDPRTVIRDRVAEAIWLANQGYDEHGMLWDWGDARDDDAVAEAVYGQADAAIAAHLEALDEASTIRTVEELNALPVGAVLRCGYGNVHRVEGPRPNRGGLWLSSITLGSGTKDLGLPARVLYRPKESP